MKIFHRILPSVLGAWALLSAETKIWEKEGVPPPQPLATRVSVGAYIFPGWYRDAGRGDVPYFSHDEQSEWKRNVMKVPGPRPLLGFYDDSLPEVNDWHIKWALEHGVSYFVFDWYWNAGEKRLARSLERGFLKAKYAPQMKFCVNWCNHGLDWKATTNGRLEFGQERLVSMIEYCADTYFKLPNHLSIDGRPVFMIYEVGPVIKACGGAEGFKKALAAMNAVMKSRHLKDLYLVYMDRYDGAETRAAGLDALTAYVWLGADPSSPYEWRGGQCLPYTEMPAYYLFKWRQLVASAPPPYLLPIGSDWDNRPRNGAKACFYTGRTPGAFKGMLSESLRFVDKRMNLALIEAWNEWGEGSYIEPDRRYQFGLLEAVAEVFGTRAASHVDWVPSAAKVRSYSVLSDAELAQAKAAETNAYPDPPLALKAFSASVDKPLPAKDPLLAWEFSAGKEGWTGFYLDALEAQGGLLTGVVNGDDPKILRDGLALPVDSIGTLAVRLRVSPGLNPVEVFWATAEEPKESPVRCTRFALETDGAWHTYQVAPIRADAWKGSLKLLRLDVGRSGDRVEYDWIRLYRK